MALRLLAISAPRDDLGTRRGAAAAKAQRSARGVEPEARAREDGADDHPLNNGQQTRESVRQAQSPRGAAASKASRCAT